MIAATLRDVALKLSGTTPRERAGLAALGAIAAVTAAVYALDWADNSAAAAAAATQSAAESEEMLSAFSNQSYRQRLGVEAGNAWRWSQADDALAGETVLAELESMCQQAGFNDPRLALVEQPAAQGQVGAIGVSINAEFNWASFLAFLEALQSSDLNYTIRSIDVAESEGVQRMALSISVPTIRAEERG
ncbi:MAG: hypothetical protein ABL932_07010 [Terricaulis sp.]